MKAITYRTMWGPEAREMEGFPTGVPGLVVSSTPSGFVIAHVRSGAWVAKGFDDPEAALAAAQLIGPLADWTCTGAEMQEYPKRPGFQHELVSIADRFGGRAPSAGSYKPDALPAHVLNDNGVIA